MEIYKGIGTNHCDHEDLIDFLNYVFGMNGHDTGFYRLLPKLYRPHYRPGTGGQHHRACYGANRNHRAPGEPGIHRYGFRHRRYADPQQCV